MHDSILFCFKEYKFTIDRKLNINYNKTKKLFKKYQSIHNNK